VIGYKQLQLDLWSLLSGADSSPYADVVFRAVDPNQKPADATEVASSGSGRPAAQSFHAHKVIIYHVRMAPGLHLLLSHSSFIFST
jgi:hypothetical protein